MVSISQSSSETVGIGLLDIDGTLESGLPKQHCYYCYCILMLDIDESRAARNIFETRTFLGTKHFKNLFK